MFKIASPDTTYTRSVRVPTPTPEGAVEDQRFNAKFRLLTGSRAEKCAGEGDEALVREALVGWSDIEDVDGVQIPFSPGALDRLVEITYWRRATALAYIDFSTGAAEKNSAALSDTS